MIRISPLAQPYSPVRRVRALALGLLLALNTPAVRARTRSVTSVVRDEGAYTSGFSRSEACANELTTPEARITTHLPLTAGNPIVTPIDDFVRRLHRAADEINALGPDPTLLPETEHAVVRYVAELDLMALDLIAPFEFELLIIFAKLHAILPDRPGRATPIYYGIRGILEKVVNLKHDDTQVSHALVAHALDQLVRLRVSRLSQVGQFEEQIRAAFEDLERLQREDARGDAEGLRVGTGLAIFTKAVPALDLCLLYEVKSRAADLERRFEPIEDAIRQAAQSHRSTIGHARRAQILHYLTDLITSPQIDLMPDLRDRAERLLTLVSNLAH